MRSRIRHDVSLLSEDDLRLFRSGRHCRLWEHLGSHVVRRSSECGTAFAVWAPNASQTEVVGDFNGWDGRAHPMKRRGTSGIWEAYVPGISAGERYKYRITGRDGHAVDKADPLARATEPAPATASIVWEDRHDWMDQQWMEARADRNRLDAPISIYEVHAGSWRRDVGGRSLDYRKLAHQLADHVERTGFTHVELLPVMEHPFYGSWGYQITGFFAPTARYGTPTDLKYFIDFMHGRGVGVLLDWVPSHFPGDDHGLARFDGTPLYEYADPRLGFHPDWKSWVFDYGREEVCSFLISSALHWLEEYHADGLRVDAVASMLYRDYSREEGEWLPNVHGGRENLEAIDFVRALNQAVNDRFSDVLTVAEESTAWPMVTGPAETGGLGFGLKWDMGWMNDILRFMSRDPVRRRWHHSDLTFRQLYAFTENFVLPFSHDEVVHGKGSLWGKMAGRERQRFANLRLVYGLMFAQPGKKLLFMGDEMAQPAEWDHDAELDWRCLEKPEHKGVMRWVTDLNRLYASEPSLYELDCESAGFEWIAPDDHAHNVISFLRHAREGCRPILAVFNFSFVPQPDYRVGVSRDGRWRELLNSDALVYGGTGRSEVGSVVAEARPFHGRPWSLTLDLPPLSVLFLQSGEAVDA